MGKDDPRPLKDFFIFPDVFKPKSKRTIKILRLNKDFDENHLNSPFAGPDWPKWPKSPDPLDLMARAKTNGDLANMESFIETTKLHLR
jgi:hypothetical protein